MAVQRRAASTVRASDKARSDSERAQKTGHEDDLGPRAEYGRHVDSVAQTFHVSTVTVTDSLFWTLCMRPVGGAVVRHAGRALRAQTNPHPEYCVFHAV